MTLFRVGCVSIVQNVLKLHTVLFSCPVLWDSIHARSRLVHNSLQVESNSTDPSRDFDTVWGNAGNGQHVCMIHPSNQGEKLSGGILNALFLTWFIGLKMRKWVVESKRHELNCKNSTSTRMMYTKYTCFWGNWTYLKWNCLILFCKEKQLKTREENKQSYRYHSTFQTPLADRRSLGWLWIVCAVLCCPPLVAKSFPYVRVPKCACKPLGAPPLSSTIWPRPFVHCVSTVTALIIFPFDWPLHNVISVAAVWKGLLCSISAMLIAMTRPQLWF